MILELLEEAFSVCKLQDTSQIKFDKEYVFVGKTTDEISLVCSSNDVPSNCIQCEHEWRCFRIKGELDFSLIGIISKISKVLAQNLIGIFVISTFNTDYILVKSEKLELAIKVLEEDGYRIVS